MEVGTRPTPHTPVPLIIISGLVWRRDKDAAASMPTAGVKLAELGPPKDYSRIPGDDPWQRALPEPEVPLQVQVRAGRSPPATVGSPAVQWPRLQAGPKEARRSERDGLGSLLPESRPKSPRLPRR